MKQPLALLIVALLLAPLTALHADDAPVAPSGDRDQEIPTRRTGYLNWIIEHFGKPKPETDPRCVFSVRT